MIGRMYKFTNAWTLFCFLVKYIILFSRGVATIGVQNSLTLPVWYEPCDKKYGSQVWATSFPHLATLTEKKS